MGIFISLLAETNDIITTADSVVIVKMNKFDLDSDFVNLNNQLDTFSNNLVKQLGINYRFNIGIDTDRVKYRFNNGLILLAKIDNKTVGFAQCIFDSKTKMCHISDVVVDETVRGKKIGEKLMNALIIDAKSNGMKSMSLSCISNNIYALKLYNSFGFKIMSHSMFSQI